MSDELASFRDVLQRVRAGSQDAAWDLIERYGPQVLRVVRRRLPPVLRRKFDSQDFVQAAWASIFAHRSRLVRFGQPHEFVGFLAAVAGNKVASEVRRRLRGQKYNVHREQSLEGQPAGSSQPVQVAAPQATPSQVAVARERWFQLIDGQTPRCRQIVEMRYGGATYQEIADEVGVTEKTVRRTIARLLRDCQP